VVSGVLSGNRNFEGRIHPYIKANYLASPPLVVAYALAGTTNIDLTTEPIGVDKGGEPVYLKDIWPTRLKLPPNMTSAHPETFHKEYNASSTATRSGTLFPCPKARCMPGMNGQLISRSRPFC